MQEKYLQYTAIIVEAISKLIEEDGELSIDKEELFEGDNLTGFFHALANVAPSCLYDAMTGNNVDILEFNHIANKLVFQYAKEKDNKTK